MIKRFMLHLAVLLAIIAVVAVPALWLAMVWSESGMFGHCMEGGCAYQALFLLFPILWLLCSAAGFALWLWLRRRSLRKRAGPR